MTRLVALVPMKGHSERVPGKNLRLIAGKPLFAWVIETLSAVRGVDVVVVDTDSAAIAGEVSDRFPGVVINTRPVELRGDMVPMHDIVAHLARIVDGDVFLQTHVTNPLLTAATVERAIAAHADRRHHDGLMSVTVRRSRFYRPDGAPVNHHTEHLERTQDLEPLLEENSNLYVATREVIQATGLRMGRNPVLFAMDPVESWDIDEEWDFRIAELLLEERARG